MYKMKRTNSLPTFLPPDIHPPHPMCRKPVLILNEEDDAVAVVLQTSVDPGKQRETMSEFCKTLNRLDFSLFYLTRSIRTKQRERGLLVIMTSNCDRALLQRCLERL